MEKEAKKFVLNSIVQTANPSFYIKENRFFDEWSLFERCQIALDFEFFKERKNLLILSGDFAEEETPRIIELYRELIYPKAVLFIGEEDELVDNLKAQFHKISYLSSDFNFSQYQEALKMLLGERNA